MEISSYLPSDRWLGGSLTVEDDNGYPLLDPVSARGKADGELAAANGNPERDPERAYGDHPTGLYLVVSVEHDKSPAHSYGPRFVLLDPITGNALIAKSNGRSGLAIHGGDPAGQDGSLRATEGCLRVTNDTALSLAELIEPELRAGRPVHYECIEAAVA